MAAHQGPGLTGNTLTVDTTAGGVQVVGPDDHHRTVLIQNIDGSVPFYIGGTSSTALTAANGFRLAAGEAIEIDLPPLGELYAISGSTGEARFIVFDGLR